MNHDDLQRRTDPPAGDGLELGPPAVLDHRLRMPLHDAWDRAEPLPPERLAEPDGQGPRASPEQVLAAEVDDSRDRRKRSLPSSWMLASVVFHVLLVMLFLFLKPLPDTPPPSELEVFAVSADQLPADVDMSVPEAPSPREPVDAPTNEPRPPRGQVVNLAPPEVPQEAPERARFLAEDNHRTSRETRAPLIQVNPGVVAPRAAKGTNTAQGSGRQPGESGEDGTAARPAPETSLAEAHPDRPDETPPDPSKQIAMVPKPARPEPKPETEERLEREERTSDEGLEPAPSRDTPEREPSPEPARPKRKLQLYPSPSQMASILGGSGAGSSGHSRGERGLRPGAPDNDVLNVPTGDETRLNAAKSVHARYFNALKRQFNYYYAQNADNLSAKDIGERVFRKTYVTRFVFTVLPDGRVGEVRLVQSSGIDAFDALALNALRQASPLPAPPAELLEDGRLTVPAECHLGVGLGIPSFDPVARDDWRRR